MLAGIRYRKRHVRSGYLIEPCSPSKSCKHTRHIHMHVFNRLRTSGRLLTGMHMCTVCHIVLAVIYIVFVNIGSEFEWVRRSFFCHMICRLYLCMCWCVCVYVCVYVFLQESLLDADHHVAVALGPADKPGSAVRTNNIQYIIFSRWSETRPLVRTSQFEQTQDEVTLYEKPPSCPPAHNEGLQYILIHKLVIYNLNPTVVKKQSEWRRSDVDNENGKYLEV